MKLNSYRRLSQILFFLLFLYLLNRTEYTGTQELKYPVRLFLDIDPYIAITTFLTTHTLPLLLWVSAITIVLTAIFGRFFCGWVCPFGSINHFTGYALAKYKSNPTRGRHFRHQRIKYVILFVTLAAALAGVHLGGFLDPISLAIRSFTVGILAPINFVIRSILYPILGSDSTIVEKFILPIYPHVKGYILSHNQMFFWQGFLIFSIFVIVLLLNLIKNRFFCRVLCPLGALLGCTSKYSILELDQSDLCDSCYKCVSSAQGGASPYEKGRWKKSECLMCMNCVSTCDRNSLKFKINLSKDRKLGSTDLRRRAIITSFASGFIAAPFLTLSPRRKTYNPDLIRPPGALGESDFLKTCVKCEECMKVCLTNVIQPTMLQAGIEGMWSPYLDMKIGYCEFKCNLCGQVCPTGAIKNLPVEEKKKVKIGLAFVDKNRCLPFAMDIPCIVCEEHCPTSPKAIKFKTVRTVDQKGKNIELKQPYVLPDICTGCGICQNKCPVLDKPAIRVTSVNEDRNPGNKWDLEEISKKSLY